MAPHPTLIRTASNHTTDDQDVKFGERLVLTEAMRAGCRMATHCPLASGEGVFDFGLGQPVKVVLDSRTQGDVAEALGLIVYQDDDLDALFFVFRSKRGGLVAVMGGSHDISRAIDGWMDFDRYYASSWDRVERRFRDVFPVIDFPALWCDADGVVSGADVEGAVVSVSKTHMYDSYDRVPEANLMRIGVRAAAYRASHNQFGGVNAH